MPPKGVVDDGEHVFRLNPNLVFMLMQDALDLQDGASPKLKMTKAALATTTELVRLFIMSARSRAEAEAMSEGHDTIAPEHIEAIMADLMTEF